MSGSNQLKPVVPEWLIWIQCTAFVALYLTWSLPEIVGVRNTALIVGALLGLYPVYQYRYYFLQKSAIPIWLIVTLFAWATFHLFFLSQDYALQLLEFKRIWKYAAIAAIFALGFGLSLMGATNSEGASEQNKRNPYWAVIFFGLCTPALLYLLKYLLTMYGARWGIEPPPYLRIYCCSQPYYVPKSDYVAFCLPPLVIALGQIEALFSRHKKFLLPQYSAMLFYLSVAAVILFLFYAQNIKNGMAYGLLFIGLFLFRFLRNNKSIGWKKKIGATVIVLICLIAALYLHLQKNHSWKTLIADTKVAVQLERYQYWKYGGVLGYPDNEFGKIVSPTNYERVAWFKAGLQLASQMPLGFGLVEGSFKHMAQTRWPETTNLSHSHSGWLDLVLAIGIPGFAMIFCALVSVLIQSKNLYPPWRALVFWGLLANALLWTTTEVAATVTFSALIFWICWTASFTLLSRFDQNLNHSQN